MMLQDPNLPAESLFFIPISLNPETAKIFNISVKKSLVIGITCAPIVDQTIEKYSPIHKFKNNVSATREFFKSLSAYEKENDGIHSVIIFKNKTNGHFSFIDNKNEILIQDVEFKKALEMLFNQVKNLNENNRWKLTIFPSMILSSCENKILKSLKNNDKNFLKIMNEDLQKLIAPIAVKIETLILFMFIKRLNIQLPKPLKWYIADLLHMMRNVKVPTRVIEQWDEKKYYSNNNQTLFRNEHDKKRKRDHAFNNDNDNENEYKIEYKLQNRFM